MNAPIAVKTMINNEKIKCYNSECKWTGELGNLIQHLENVCL